MTDSKFSFSALSVFQRAVLAVAIESADESKAVKTIKVEGAEPSETIAAFKTLVEKGHVVAADGKPFLSDAIAADRASALAALKPRTAAKSERKATIVGGALTRTAFDAAAATRKGSLHLTEKRRAMLVQVRDAKTPPDVSWHTNVEKNTLHAPTAERLALLGLLHLSIVEGVRVAAITADGRSALDGSALVGPAPSKRASKSEKKSEKKSETAKAALADKKAGRPRSVSEKPSKKKATKKSAKPTQENALAAGGAPVALPKPKDIRGKDRRINPAALLGYLLQCGVEAKAVRFSASADGAKKLLASFSLPLAINSDKFAENAKKSGLSFDRDGNGFVVKNVRYNAKLAA